MTRKLRAVRLSLLVAALLATSPAYADLSVAGGITSESTAALKVELDREFSLESWHPRLSLRLATGLLLLSSDTEHGNAAWLLTPAFRYTFAGESGTFLEAGIGASVFLETRVESRELSTSFQFEDRLALGMPLARGEIMASVTHYSNARIARPNDGFEVFALSYRRPW
ncbi:acyloxyacyl hydrolase [Litchfieldella rifensis]|uniref:Acyloxyacyl hydrolase n=1 Tax=Litchfieldella rifensis TaxID=762643 RepID=A0ABV7LP17_9GAMM